MISHKVLRACYAFLLVNYCKQQLKTIARKITRRTTTTTKRYIKCGLAAAAHLMILYICYIKLANIFYIRTSSVCNMLNRISHTHMALKFHDSIIELGSRNGERCPSVARICENDLEKIRKKNRLYLYYVYNMSILLRYIHNK